MTEFWQEAVETGQIQKDGHVPEVEIDKGSYKKYLRAQKRWLEFGSRVSQL